VRVGKLVPVRRLKSILLSARKGKERIVCVRLPQGKGPLSHESGIGAVQWGRLQIVFLGLAERDKSKQAEREGGGAGKRNWPVSEGTYIEGLDRVEAEGEEREGLT